MQVSVVINLKKWNLFRKLLTICPSYYKIFYDVTKLHKSTQNVSFYLFDLKHVAFTYKIFVFDAKTHCQKT